MGYRLGGESTQVLDLLTFTWFNVALDALAPLPSGRNSACLTFMKRFFFCLIIDCLIDAFKNI